MSAKTRHSRRRLLKSIAGAGGVYAAGKMLPEQWTKPVVDAVSLPAHAQTSGPFFGVIPLPPEEASAPAGLLDLIFPKAYAQEAGREAHICVVPSGSDAMVDIVVLGFFTPSGTGVQFDGVVPVGGENSLSVVDTADGCEELKKADVSLRLDSLAKGALRIGIESFTFDLPPAECDLPDLGVCEEPGP